MNRLAISTVHGIFVLQFVLCIVGFIDYKLLADIYFLIHPMAVTGVEGGFQVDDFKVVFDEQLSVVILPDWLEVQLPNADLPQIVSI